MAIPKLSLFYLLGVFKARIENGAEAPSRIEAETTRR